MKKSQLILAAALVALAACNKDSFDLTGPNTLDNEIGFNAVTKKATKANDAIITGAVYDTLNTFRVWGWQSKYDDLQNWSDLDTVVASNFMDSLKIEYTGGRLNRAKAWRNADNYYYWPFTGKIGFLAIHPSNLNTPTDTTLTIEASWDASNKMAKASIENYSVVGRDSTDLMFAFKAGQRRADALPITFKHALSQIQFRVRTNEDYWSVDSLEFKVDSIFIHNIDLKGNVVYEKDTVAWSENEAQDTSSVYYKGTQIVNYHELDKDADLYGRGLVMIPQPANQIDTTVVPKDLVQTTLTVGYTMKQKKNAAISGTVTVPAPQEWLAGKRYLYTLNFKLNEILFNPDVTKWVDVDVQTINILD